MPSGGHRDGAGRPKGSPNKATAAKAAEIAATGETPLDYMLRVMRDASADHDRRDKMGVAAAPYVHARLAAMEVTGADGEALIPKSDPRELSKAVLAIMDLLRKGVKDEPEPGSE